MFSESESQIPGRLPNIPHLTMRTCKLIDDIRNEIKRERIFRLKERTDSVRVCENKHKFGVGVRLAEQVLEAFPDAKT